MECFETTKAILRICIERKIDLGNARVVGALWLRPQFSR
jgi:hypothetical protein